MNKMTALPLLFRLSSLLLLSLLLATYSQAQDHNETANSDTAQSQPTPAASQAISRQWANSCALCHATGVGGAPRINNASDWQPRLAQGKSVLLQHTIEGFNDMPPLGYCMSCEREDLSRLIDFMTAIEP